jgi:hypothetical protein
MDTQLKQFEKIWNMYSAIMDMNDYEFNKYIKIIHKIRQNDFDFSKCKDDFIELIKLVDKSTWIAEWDFLNRI